MFLQQSFSLKLGLYGSRNWQNYVYWVNPIILNPCYVMIKLILLFPEVNCTLTDCAICFARLSQTLVILTNFWFPLHVGDSRKLLNDKNTEVN